MEEAVYNNRVTLYPEINSIREPDKQTTPEVAMNFGIKQRILWYRASVSIEYSKELVSKPWGLFFVPVIGGNSIIFHFWQEAQGVCHFLFAILLWSSSRDRRFPGFIPCLSNLLSNSSIWL